MWQKHFYIDKPYEKKTSIFYLCLFALILSYYYFLYFDICCDARFCRLVGGCGTHLKMHIQQRQVRLRVFDRGKNYRYVIFFRSGLFRYILGETCEPFAESSIFCLLGGESAGFVACKNGMEACVKKENEGGGGGGGLEYRSVLRTAYRLDI